MKRLAAVALLALLVLAAPAGALPSVTEKASSGSIRAEFSFTPHLNDKRPDNLVLRVFDGDRMIVEDKLPNDDFLTPLNFYRHVKSVTVRDLDADGKPEALFGLFTGGAHCCVQTRIYHGTMLIERDWGNVGYELKDFDGDGVPEFASYDDAFSARYSSYAASLTPVQVFELRGGRFIDFTRDPSVRPAIVTQAADFRRLYRKYRRRARNKDSAKAEAVRSALAGYAADRCSLGDCAGGYALLRRARARGDLKGFKDFPARVRKDLRRWGYDSGGGSCCPPPLPVPAPVR